MALQNENTTLPRQTEVVVIGGGIAGSMTAFFLAKRGVPVVLCEKGRIAGEQSSRNWGWVRKQGRDPLELPAIIESLKIWEGLEEELQSDIGWQQGGVTYLARSDADLAEFESWLEHAKQHQLDSRLLSSQEADALLKQDAGRWKGALYTPSDGRAEPGKAVPAIVKACERMGVVVVTNCAVRSLDLTAGRVSGVVTERGPIACQSVVCAGGAWSGLFNRNLGYALPQLKVKASVLRTAPITPINQSGTWCDEVAIRPRQDGGYTIARGGAGTVDLVPDSLKFAKAFWPGYQMSKKHLRLRLSGAFVRELVRPTSWQPDQVTPFEKVRVLDPEPDHALLQEALAAAQRHFPQLKGVKMAESWGGMIDVTPDALPVMSAMPGIGGYYVATGYSGHGFGMGAATGKLMSELVVGAPSSVDMHPFRFGRFSDGSKLLPYGAL